MWTRFLVASRVDPVVLVSSAGLSFFGWTRPRTRRRKRKYRNWTIYVQKKQRKLAVALCFFFGQEEARPFSDVCLSRNGGTIFLNIFSSLPVNFSFW